MGRSEESLSTAAWTRIVAVAGVGTVLEWFDFYTFVQLTSTLKKVFFPKSDPTAQTLLWWAIYAVGFVVRPLGALLFGTIGDIYGRNLTLRIAIVCMAIPTVIIACLPTYNLGPYTAGIAAPILLTVLRLLQGLAMGGEFGSAIIYISELAPVAKRGRMVACLQMTVNIGMVLATVFVMILEAALSPYQMQLWGWRIPFASAFFTAVLGFWMRAGLPEPKAFLNRCRAERDTASKAAMADGVSASIHTAPSTKSFKDDASSASSDEMSEEAFEEAEAAQEGALSRFHGHHTSKIPIIRLLRNNLLGLGSQVLYMAWVSAAFYATVTWLPAQLRDAGMAPRVAQGIVIVSMFTNAAGLFACGTAFDKGVRAIGINLVVSVVGMSVGFGIFRGKWTSAAAQDANALATWFLIPIFQGIIGVAMASVVLPSTRLYDPLERTTGFSFGYNCGYGIVGGLTPFAVAGIIDSLSSDLKAYAAPFWMLALGGATLLGCATMRMYMPRLNAPFVGRIE